MRNMDIYMSVGFALELLAASPYHRQHKYGPYLDTEILTPLKLGQYRFYLAENGAPTAMATWAWLSAEVEAEVHATGRALADDEWQCGNRLFFNDFIAPYDNLRAVMHDLTHVIFPNATATSVRRHADGSVRQIRRWTGVNRRRTAAQAGIGGETAQVPPSD
ncbi:toxin-activating lysine-acyltransferase [Pelagibacterium halotolerans]|uniref:toxin-activating lysine-acyltransferase n=1 Tax=Pelagibacterium halotolerans TaxID=531813 RepID=UPI00384D6367